MCAHVCVSAKAREVCVASETHAKTKQFPKKNQTLKMSTIDDIRAEIATATRQKLVAKERKEYDVVQYHQQQVDKFYRKLSDKNAQRQKNK